MTSFKRSLLCAASSIAMLGTAHAVLTKAGDLQFTAFNADEDGFAMVTLVDITANSTVFFSDNEYLGSAFNTGESYFRWDSGSAVVAAGSVIRFSAIDVAARSASVGSFTQETVASSNNVGLSQSGDTLYAYLGAVTAPTTFLSAISTDGFTSVAAGDELVGTGLVIGSNAVALKAASDYAEYAGVRSGLSTFAQYGPLVANVANWNDLGDGTFAANVPNLTAFTVTAVPEPQSYALWLGGLGAVALLARRRSR